MNPNPKRVLAISSGGGHWVQLLRLRPAFAGHLVTYATVNADYAEQVPGERFQTIPDATRWDRWGVLKMAFAVLWLVLRVRPQVLVTTGAGPGLVALAIARLLGARTVWVDSIANVEEMSMSGRKARRFAHLWLTQWPHLARSDGPRHEGAVL